MTVQSGTLATVQRVLLRQTTHSALKPPHQNHPTLLMPHLQGVLPHLNN